MKRLPFLRRSLLISLVIVVMIDGVWLYRTSRQHPRFAFQLETTLTTVSTDPANPSREVSFNPEKNVWMSDNGVQVPAALFIRDADPEKIGPDSIGLYIVVQLPGHADIDALRRALLALSSENICKAAFVPAASSLSYREAFVSRLLSVSDDRERTIRCNDRNY